MLPYLAGAEMVMHGEFEPGNETYVLDDVHCTGDELNLWDCSHEVTPNCDIGEDDAGVRCMDRGECSAEQTEEIIFRKYFEYIVVI